MLEFVLSLSLSHTHTHTPHTHTDVWALSTPIFVEAPTDLERPPYSQHSLLLGQAASKPLQGPGLSQDPEPDGAFCPTHSPPLLLRGKDDPGEAGECGRGPQEGVPKGEEEKTEFPHFQRKPLLGGLFSFPFSLLLLLISPPTLYPYRVPASHRPL